MRRKMSSNLYQGIRRQVGLTLLEVLVALAVFAITGSAILKAVGDNLSSVGQIESVTFANWVANNQLARVQLERSWPLKNNLRGSEVMADREWFWVQEVKNTNEEDMKQVTITVGLDSTYEGSITSVTAYFAKPRTKGIAAGSGDDE